MQTVCIILALSATLGQPASFNFPSLTYYDTEVDNDAGVVEDRISGQPTTEFRLSSWRSHWLMPDYEEYQDQAGQPEVELTTLAREGGAL